MLGLTHEQLAQLRNQLYNHGFGRQGRSYTETDATKAALGVGVLQRQLNVSANKAINAVAEMHLSSPATIRNAVRTAATGGTLHKSTEHRGKGNPDHPLFHTDSIPLEGELLLHRQLTDVRLHDTYQSASTLQSALATELAIDKSLYHHSLVAHQRLFFS